MRAENNPIDDWLEDVRRGESTMRQLICWRHCNENQE